MDSRSERRRSEQRRVLAWSLGVAAVLHVIAFLVLPGLRADPEFVSELVLEGVPAIGGAVVDVRFGPPAITRADGSTVQEPPGRSLQVVRKINLPGACLALVGREETSGTVQLVVRDDGRVEDLEIVEGTGSDCGDRLMADLAEDLRYRWLPTQEFPAPVVVSQPVTIVEVVELMEADPD